jgi:hypothetical protein
VVIDLANSPSFEDKAVLAFLQTSGRNLFAAGVRHHVALSIVGTDRTPDDGYSPSHTHAKSAFIYATVLEGAIRSQVNDGPVTTYKASLTTRYRAPRRPQGFRTADRHPGIQWVRRCRIPVRMTAKGRTSPFQSRAGKVPDRRTGAIRQAAGRGATANGRLIAMGFPNRFSIFRDGRRV